MHRILKFSNRLKIDRLNGVMVRASSNALGILKANSVAVVCCRCLSIVFLPVASTLANKSGFFPIGGEMTAVVAVDSIFTPRIFYPWVFIYNDELNALYWSPIICTRNFMSRGWIAWRSLSTQISWTPEGHLIFFVCAGNIKVGRTWTPYIARYVAWTSVGRGDVFVRSRAPFIVRWRSTLVFVRFIKTIYTMPSMRFFYKVPDSEFLRLSHM